MPVDTPVDDKSTVEQAEVAQAQEYQPGELAPCIVTSQKIWKPEDLKAIGLDGVIKELVKTVSNTDEAARRFQVLQTWEMRHVDRGYQYLEGDKGGWRIAGTDGAGKNTNSLAAMDDAGLYPTNILSAQGDIATGALCRGKIKVSFAPRRSKNPADVAAADEANQYKYLWEKNNPEYQRDIMNAGWTDCRIVGWTRSVADKRFGLNDDGSPRILELSTAHGILESKLPMMVDKLSDCGYAQLFEEMDYAVARAAYPWMGDKIKPSWGTFGELEFERIARINTRIGIVGKYITGTSGIREATMGYNWFRPGMYFDDNIQAVQREALLSNFADGLFVVMAGTELCCCWNECMDDHLTLGLYTRGFGQNRRSLGSSDLPIQKRVNIWADLWDKFFRTAIPITLLEDKAFNPEAISQLEASPSRFVAVALDEGQAIADVVGQTPAPQPIQGMAEIFQWYVGPLIQSIDGATPALFGGGEGQDNTVGATQIRLNQALERYGTPWIMGNHVMARSCAQAAKCCGENGNAEISDNVAGYGDVTVNPANLKGDFECSPETLGSIPESGAQREAKVLQILDMANSNPQVASIVATPSNAREIVKALHIDDVITVDEADSEDGALEDIERLLDGEPLINPAWQQLTEQIELLNTTHEAAKQIALQAVQGGDSLSPEILEQGNQMEQQLGQLQQQLQQTPQYLPSIPVPDDESLDYSTITATVFSWMQNPDGRSLRRAAAKEPPGGKNWKKWTNVFLYWQANKKLAAQFTKAQAPPPKVNITGKLTPEQQAQLLMMQAGIQTSPQSLQEPHEAEQETRIYTPVSEVTTKVKKRL